MNAITEWGLSAIRAVQSIKSEALTAAMVAVSLLGSQYLLFAAVPLLYWCVDARRASRMGFVACVALFAALAIKQLVGEPRPFELDPAVGLALEASRSFPSAHAVCSAVFWGMAGAWAGGKKGVAIALVPIALVGLSRVYLGVHYPVDVLGGWAIAAIVLGVHKLSEKRLRALMRAAGHRVQAALAVLAAVGINAFSRELSYLAGAVFGLGLGYVFERRIVALDAGSGNIARKAARAAIGLGGLALVLLGPSSVIPAPPDPAAPLALFAQFALAGFWINFGAPLVFVRAGLAGSKRRIEAPEG